MSQTVGITQTRYALDPAAGLTQVLADGSTTYLYGNGRIAQQQTNMQYFGADGLGSVRQIYNNSGQIIANHRYDPFGSTISQSGVGASNYGFTGEWTDATGLEYLRARYYAPVQGRFVTKDTWPGDNQRPGTLNGWNYVQANPVNFTDPAGLDLIIVGGAGWSGTDPYVDPSSWETWISAYTGWTHREFMDKWYTPWKASGVDDSKKMTLAQETGIAVFKWERVPGNAQAFGNSREAARYVQRQIDDWNLKDVTILSHSKGAVVATSLMSLYEKGELQKGAVKNVIIIDPPQGSLWDWIWGGTTSVDAQKAGVKAVVLLGQVECGLCPCQTTIKNATEIPYDFSHDIRSGWADWIFDHLPIDNDAHARKR